MEMEQNDKISTLSEYTAKTVALQVKWRYWKIAHEAQETDTSSASQNLDSTLNQKFWKVPSHDLSLWNSPKEFFQP